MKTHRGRKEGRKEGSLVFEPSAFDIRASSQFRIGLEFDRTEMPAYLSPSVEFVRRDIIGGGRGVIGLHSDQVVTL